jgi:hypothetical protein
MAKREQDAPADERVSIPLPFEDAMRGLLAVKPDESDGNGTKADNEPAPSDEPK